MSKREIDRDHCGYFAAGFLPAAQTHRYLQPARKVCTHGNFKSGSAHPMTAIVDPHQAPHDGAWSGDLALTLPAGIKPLSAALQSPLSCDAHLQRQPDHASSVAEIAALLALATALGESPYTAYQVLADRALALLKAGSAGVSVLSVQGNGGTLVRWPAIAGRWQAHSGSSRLLLAPATPAAASEPIAEHYLVVPFGVAGQMAGTVWVVAHDAALGFDAEDLRQLQSLALFAAPALQAMAARDSAPTPHPSMMASGLPGASEGQHATFNSLIENAPFGVYVVDAQFCLCQASAAARKAFASVQPLIGRHFGDIVRAVWSEPFASEVLAHFRRTLDSGKAHAQPTVSEPRKDTPHTESYDWKIERIVLPDGTYGVVCYFYDLTERHQAAEALRLRTAQFETLVNEAPLGIYLVDAQLCIRQVNPPALPEFGTIQDLIGSDLAAVMQTLWGPARADEIVQQFRHTLTTGEPFEVAELIALRADRSTTASYEWQIHRIPLPDGSHGVVCYFRDISTRVKAQAEIRDSELRFRAFVTASADAVYCMSPDWREMRHLNGRNFIANTHAPTAQWMQDYIHPQDHPRVLAAIDAAIAAKDLFELEHRVLRVDGELGWTHSRAVPLLDAAGAIVEWIGTATDVTDRKGIEADLIAALAAAKDANQAKSDFLSHMSHELRSPLNAVLGFAQLLQSGTVPLTARQEKDVGEILKAGWYLLGLIDEILDLSLIESGRLSCVLAPVRLAEVLDDCHALVEGQAAALGVRLSVPRLDADCIVTVDRTRIKQVFINILSNAIKYNRTGGTVQVRCEAAGQDRLRICIEDSGIGLSPEQLDHIFQPFERLGQEAGTIQGIGIGLALSKRLVELMGGRIGVRSVVSQGSVFWVELDAPGAQASAPASAPEADPAKLGVTAEPPTAGGRSPCTVLYVEDNHANQLLVQRLLARRPEMHLLLAGDAEQGLQLARAMQPDVVLMDINLPGLSGLDAMAHLAADAATAHIPVIAVSAMAMQHDIDKGLQAGFFRYLSKPIKIEALTEALDAALAQAEQPQAPAGPVAARPVREASPATKARKL